jgi:hypothetical protein
MTIFLIVLMIIAALILLCCGTLVFLGFKLFNKFAQLDEQKILVVKVKDKLAELVHLVEELIKLHRESQKEVARRQVPVTQAEFVPKAPAQPVTQSPPEVETFVETFKDLYQSAELREKRDKSRDLYLEPDQDSLQACQNGASEPVLFEKKSNIYYAPLVLVEGKYLYVNFNKYNESLALGDTQKIMLEQLYTISGTLPGKVSTCKPAFVSPQDDGKYAVSEKGTLVITD